MDYKNMPPENKPVPNITLTHASMYVIFQESENDRNEENTTLVVRG